MALATIDDFKSLISDKGGAARSNIFRVELPTLPGATKEQINLLCRDANLPGRQILTRERTIGITTKKMAYGYLSEDVSMTFQVLNDYGIKEYIETWQNLAVNQTTKEIGYKKDYSFPVKIQQLKKGISLPTYNKRLGLFELNVESITRDDIVYEVELLDAFPTTMNAIQLNNDQDGLVELNIQLSYTNWKSGFTEPANSNNILNVFLGTLLSRFFV